MPSGGTKARHVAGESGMPRSSGGRGTRLWRWSTLSRRWLLRWRNVIGPTGCWHALRARPVPRSIGPGLPVAAEGARGERRAPTERGDPDEGAGPAGAGWERILSRLSQITGELRALVDELEGRGGVPPGGAQRERLVAEIRALRRELMELADELARTAPRLPHDTSPESA